MKAEDIFWFFIMLSVALVVVGFGLLLARISKARINRTDASLQPILGAFDALGTELKSMKEQMMVKERLAALGEVSAGIIHELRNPLSVIVGYARVLHKTLEEEDPKRPLVEAILKEAETMNSIVEELRRFSKAESLKKEGFKICPILFGIRDNLDPSGERLFIPEGPDLKIYGDKTLISHALLNVIENALEVGDKVVVDLKVEALQGLQPRVVISVRDNGPGLKEEDLTKVFLPFYTTKEKGLGMGLAFAQKIVMAHGGKIEMENSPEGGCICRVSLPLY